MKFTSTITVALFSAFALSAIPACDDKKADDKKAEDKKDAKGKADDKKADGKKVEEKKAEPAPEEKKEEAKADAPAGGGDKIGVPECDEFIEKYTKCINDKVPEAGRAAQQTGLDAMVKTYKDQAAGQGKDQLAATCKTASETIKQSMTAIGCAW